MDMSLTIWSADILHLAPCEVPPASYRIFFARARVACALCMFWACFMGNGFPPRKPVPTFSYFHEINACFVIVCTERAVCRVCVLSLRARAHAGVVCAGVTRAGASKVMRAEGGSRISFENGVDRRRFSVTIIHETGPRVRLHICRPMLLWEAAWYFPPNGHHCGVVCCTHTYLLGVVVGMPAYL